MNLFAEAILSRPPRYGYRAIMKIDEDHYGITAEYGREVLTMVIEDKTATGATLAAIQRLDHNNEQAGWITIERYD